MTDRSPFEHLQGLVDALLGDGPTGPNGPRWGGQDMPALLVGIEGESPRLGCVIEGGPVGDRLIRAFRAIVLLGEYTSILGCVELFPSNDEESEPLALLFESTRLGLAYQARTIQKVGDHARLGAILTDWTHAADGEDIYMEGLEPLGVETWESAVAFRAARPALAASLAEVRKDGTLDAHVANQLKMLGYTTFLSSGFPTP